MSEDPNLGKPEVPRNFAIVLLPFVKASCGPIQHKQPCDPCSHIPKEFKHWQCLYLTLLCAGKGKRCIQSFAAKDMVGTVMKKIQLWITPNLVALQSSSYRMGKLLSDGAGLGESRDDRFGAAQEAKLR